MPLPPKRLCGCYTPGWRRAVKVYPPINTSAFSFSRCFFSFQICSYFPPSVMKVEWPIQRLHRARIWEHKTQSNGFTFAVAKGTPFSQKLSWGHWISTHPWSLWASSLIWRTSTNQGVLGEPGAGAHTLSSSDSWTTGRNGWPLRIPLWNKSKPTWLT